MFVRFSCGCVGLIVGPAALAEDPILQKEDLILIDACDQDNHSLAFAFDCRLPFGHKMFIPLNQDEVRVLAGALNDLVADGYRFREVKRLLK